ncbi:MAG: MarR family winged helix-turn-helix transcriptional regulator [Gemmatimonadales bacterium]
MADRLHSAAIRLLRTVRETDRAMGLSGPRASALSVVVFKGPLTMGALAAAEQVKPPTMTRLVAALERQGLVTRAADPADGRVQIIRATARGRAVLQAGRRRRVARIAEMLQGLPAGDRQVLDRAADLIRTMSNQRD